MKKLIDKAALAAEVERIKKSIIPDIFLSEYEEGCNRGKEDVCDDLLFFINTLEVKEVDLEKETDKWYNTKASKEFENVFYGDIEECAKYFFELGLKTQKGE